MTTLDLAQELADHLRGLTRREHDALVATGVLEDAKVELLRGLVVELSPKGVTATRSRRWQRSSRRSGADGVGSRRWQDVKDAGLALTARDIRDERAVNAG